MINIDNVQSYVSNNFGKTEAAIAVTGFVVGACVNAMGQNSSNLSQIASGIAIASICVAATLSFSALATAYGVVETGLMVGAAAGFVFSLASPGDMSVAKVVGCTFFGAISVGFAAAFAKDISNLKVVAWTPHGPVFA